MNNLDEVFGVTPGMVLSYVERNAVDNYFRSALSSRKQIVVYGSSKQGKSSLIRRHLKEEDRIQYQSDPAANLVDIYKWIVRQSGAIILSGFEEAQTTGVEGGGAVKVKVGIPYLAQAEVTGSGKGEMQRQNAQQYQTVEYNLALVQDVIELLKTVGFKKYIVIDNFHYLSDEVQQKFAFALRNFQDTDIRVIVLGIWRERDRLLQFNGDLQDRIFEIAVEPWEKADLQEIVWKGSAMLNVDFSQIEEDLIGTSFDSVGVLQELLKESCVAAGVLSTSGEQVIINKEHVQTAILRKLESYSSRHVTSFDAFVQQDKKITSDGDMPLFIPYYFLQVLLTSDFDLVHRGLSRDYLHEQIAAIHHRGDDVRSGDMSNFLHTIIKYQVSRRIVPPLFDYDKGIRMLKIMDSTLYFFLKNCNREQVKKGISRPSEELPAPY